jgi:hypothetical protein
MQDHCVLLDEKVCFIAEEREDQDHQEIKIQKLWKLMLTVLFILLSNRILVLIFQKRIAAECPAYSKILFLKSSMQKLSGGCYSCKAQIQLNFEFEQASWHKSLGRWQLPSYTPSLACQLCQPCSEIMRPPGRMLPAALHTQNPQVFSKPYAGPN